MLAIDTNRQQTLVFDVQLTIDELMHSKHQCVFMLWANWRLERKKHVTRSPYVA